MHFALCFYWLKRSLRFWYNFICAHLWYFGTRTSWSFGASHQKGIISFDVFVVTMLFICSSLPFQTKINYATTTAQVRTSCVLFRVSSQTLEEQKTHPWKLRDEQFFWNSLMDTDLCQNVFIKIGDLETRKKKTVNTFLQLLKQLVGIRAIMFNILVWPGDRKRVENLIGRADTSTIINLSNL